MRRLFGRRRPRDPKEQQPRQPQQQQLALQAHPLSPQPSADLPPSPPADTPATAAPEAPAEPPSPRPEGTPPPAQLHTSPSGRQLWRVPASELLHLSGSPSSRQPLQPTVGVRDSNGGGSVKQLPPLGEFSSVAAPGTGMAPPAGTPAAAANAQQDNASTDQRPQPGHSDAAAPAANAPPSPPPPPSKHQAARPDRQDAAATQTPFQQHQPYQQQQPSYPPYGYPGAAAAPPPPPRGASRASSVAGTAASVLQYGGYGSGAAGRVDLDLDVAVVGAGITGLASALALKRVHPRLRVRVFDRRPAPADPHRKYGAYCRLEPNGLRAAAAIHPRLRQLILRHGLPARQVLIHDTDGSLITRLEERRPTSGQPYITIGWYELEQALLSLLPPGTVQYGSQYLGHRERDDAAYITFRPSAARPRPTTPPPAGRAGAAANGGGAAAAAAASAPTLVRAQFLVACDGPFSEVRKRVVRDGDPMYDGVVKWLGRLPGDDVPSLPLDFNAVWLSPGRTFLSHSLAGGDIAWEAVVTDPDLQALGFRYNTAAKRVERVLTPLHAASWRGSVAREPSLGPAKTGGAAGRRPPYGALEDTARRLFAGAQRAGAGGPDAAAPAGPGDIAAAAGGGPYDSAAGSTAAAMGADVSYLDSDELASDAEEAEGAHSEEEGEEDARGKGEVLE
ncbi:hypothetical protein TSOC_001916, partial [Tetrabaena socialis]